jgi:hypothetical protein
MPDQHVYFFTWRIRADGTRKERTGLSVGAHIAAVELKRTRARGCKVPQLRAATA